MKSQESFTEEGLGRARRVSWTELDRIRWELEAAGGSLRYAGNHMDDWEELLWAVFLDGNGRAYCARLR